VERALRLYRDTEIQSPRQTGGSMIRAPR
jgi:hypothetical protein